MEQQASCADTTKTRPGTLTRRTYLRHVRHRTIKDIDRRSRGGRRALQLIKQFTAELGGEITEAQRMAVARASIAQALAEDASVRRLNGDESVSLEDVVRLDNAADRARRALTDEAEPSEQAPTLGSLLRG